MQASNVDEVPVGCSIVHDNKIIGQGYNQCESLNDATAHAEMIAITSASSTLDNWRLNECALYVTKHRKSSIGTPGTRTENRQSPNV